jgi:hypothetical protein
MTHREVDNYTIECGLQNAVRDREFDLLAECIIAMAQLSNNDKQESATATVIAESIANTARQLRRQQSETIVVPLDKLNFQSQAVVLKLLCLEPNDPLQGQYNCPAYSVQLESPAAATV